MGGSCLQVSMYGKSIYCITVINESISEFKNIFVTYVTGDSKHSFFYDSACLVANETYIKMFIITA